ncbi:MAG: threonine--tRNA ligase [Planctomycetota bacterium]|nr:MAG: threonine--tRNA ligase [Planctomycetota bacterium]
MAKVTLPDGKILDTPNGVTVADVAGMIGQKLAKDAIAGKINGELADLSQAVTQDCKLEILTPKADNPDSMYVLRHSCAHVMAEAVCYLFPETKLVYGPPVDNGYYYDIDLDRPITPEDFEAIEAKMTEIVKADKPFIRYEMGRDEGMTKLKAEDNRYKIDNAERAEGLLSFYTTGTNQGSDFEDLCRGPHVPSTGRVGAFKITSVAGAYYRGDAREKMLQRIYGTVWPSKKELADYLHRLEEAKKRDHRILGKQLDLYSMHEEIGPGLVHWHPKGSLIRYLIERFWTDEHLKRGYDIVYTPHIASERIYQVSGHLEKYADMMYSPMDIDGVNYYLKPMNCPSHYKMYLSDIRSYRDLPIRMCELGTVYRYEPSGTLHGMLRVRGFTQDDAHTFCTPEQLGQELDLILELMDFMMRSFGYSYKAYLATRPEKYLGTLQEWERATEELRAALQRRDLDYEIDEGGGVFYAPKIDIKLIDSMGREWQGPTHQVDLQAAKRFGITYVGADNAPHEPIIIHRTVLGSMERFVGGLIEHYAGAFPMWLAPVHAVVASISEKSASYAREVYDRLRNAGLRVELDTSAEKIGPKKHNARKQKVPYILVVGEKEAADGTVNVNDRTGKTIGTERLDSFIARCKKEIDERALGTAIS